MKARWLFVLSALLLAPACGDKSSKSQDEKAEKDDEDDGDKDKKKKKNKGDKAESSSSAKTTSSAAVAPTTTPPPAPTEAPKPPMTKEQLDTFLKDEKAPMTPEAYETLLLAISECRLESSGIDWKCQAYKTFNDAQSKHKSDDYKMPGKISFKHLRHPAEAVRYTVISNAAWHASSGDGADKYLEAAQAETNPFVVARFISSGKLLVSDKKEIIDWVVSKLDDKESRVREEAALFISDPKIAKKVDGAYEKLLAKAEGDSDNGVRRHACEGLYATSNEAAIAVFEKLIVKDSPDEVRNGCMEGLLRSWTGWPYPEKPSKAGYELTMKILEATPRTEDMPPSTISAINNSSTEQKTSDGKEWLQNVKDFYDKARIVKALEAIGLDEKASSSVRHNAIYALKRLGEQAKLAEMAPIIAKQSGYSAKSLSESAEKYSKEKATF